MCLSSAWAISAPLLFADPEAHETHTQDQLMQLFFSDMNKTIVGQLISHGRANFCPRDSQKGWDGVRCFYGIVRAVHYQNLYAPLLEGYGNFRVEFLPNSVQQVYIRMCQQVGEIQTRMLPRKAVHVTLCLNRFYGSLHLQALPQKLISFNVAHNNLSGNISLFALPRTLERLDLLHNAFDKSIVYCSDLPHKLTRVSLPQFCKDSKNVRAVHGGFSEKDEFIIRWLIMGENSMQIFVRDACR